MIHVFTHELRLAVRQLGDLAALILFFIISFSLFPFALGPEPQTLKQIAPGIIWVSVLFTTQLSLPRLFTEDFEDGSLEILILNSPHLELPVLAKLAAFWLVTILPIVFVIPVATLAFGLDFKSSLILIFAICLGSLSLVLVGAIASALALGSRQASLLMPLLTLPLYVPILIFGVAAVEAVIGDFGVSQILYVLSGLALLFLPLGLFLTALVLKQAVHS